MKIFVISLAGSEQRRKLMSDQLKKLGLDFEFMDAFLANDKMYELPEYDAGKRLKYYGYHLTSGEIACTLSHLKAIHKAVELNQPILIMEDDVIIESDLVDFINKLEPQINSHDFDILRIYGLRKKSYYKIKSGDFTFVKFFKQPHGAQGYIIKPEAALNFLKYTKKFVRIIDSIMDRDYLHRLKVYASYPYLLEHAKMPSDIGSRKGKRKKWKVKLIKALLDLRWSLQRFFYTRYNYLYDKYRLKRVVD